MTAHPYESFPRAMTRRATSRTGRTWRIQIQCAEPNLRRHAGRVVCERDGPTTPAEGDQSRSSVASGPARGRKRKWAVSIVPGGATADGARAAITGYRGQEMDSQTAT